MKKTYVLFVALATTSIILSGCFKEAEPEVFGNGDTGEVVNYTQVNCEKSGGTFTDGACGCAEGFTYNEKSGLCADESGTPGGTLGAEVKGETTVEVEVQ